MAIKTTIHTIRMNPNNAIVTLKDGNHVVLDRANVPIDLNPDGTANVAWVSAFSKYHAFSDRLWRLYYSPEDDLI